MKRKDETPLSQGVTDVDFNNLHTRRLF